MKDARFHIVVAGAALLTSVAGAAVYMLLAGERGGLKLLGWSIMLIVTSYPALLIAVRSRSEDPCTRWLRRIATGRGLV